ncbi:hypothetical protein RCL_jg24062.t1 [Rhizophagus clarus]|uniref:Uncharacterized protein n=1 Tax=Rhizophagus clarus TaxID=94130 RepID=A0A8H3LMH5_9GLOM|nr:hypothetical protein RCL_jg24062.t1 [Rhizophagus clarus]
MCKFIESNDLIHSLIRRNAFLQTRLKFYWVMEFFKIFLRILHFKKCYYHCLILERKRFKIGREAYGLDRAKHMNILTCLSTASAKGFGFYKIYYC